MVISFPSLALAQGGKHPAVALLCAFQINILFPIQQLFSGCFSQRSRWLPCWYLMPDQRDCPAQNHPAGAQSNFPALSSPEVKKKKSVWKEVGMGWLAHTMAACLGWSPCGPFSGLGLAVGTPRSSHGSILLGFPLLLPAAALPALPRFILCLPPLPTTPGLPPHLHPSLPVHSSVPTSIQPCLPASMGASPDLHPGWWPTSPHPPGQWEAAECHG